MAFKARKGETMKVLSKEEIQQQAQQIYVERDQSALIYQGRLQQLAIMLEQLEDKPKEEVKGEVRSKAQPVQEIPSHVDKEEVVEEVEEQPEQVEGIAPDVQDKVFNHYANEWQPREQAEKEIAEEQEREKEEERKAEDKEEEKAEEKEEKKKEDKAKKDRDDKIKSAVEKAKQQKAEAGESPDDDEPDF